MLTPEILAPAGSREALETACLYGADAVYLGLKGETSLRAKADNFSPDELADAVAYAHGSGVKVYLTLNAYPHDGGMTQVSEAIEAARAAGVDAIIVADIGVLRLVRRQAPGMCIHLSTQANAVNVPAVLAWAELGVSRVILARELNASEIAFIRKKTAVELEIFVHGGICISVSGRCLISNYLCSRDANQGLCTQPCRWDYAVVERTRPGQYLPVAEEAGTTFLFNSKDLCLLPVWDQVMGLGLNGLKIEGRGRTALYVATITAVYRRARDAWLKDPHGFTVEDAWLEEVRRTSHREYFTGFFSGLPGQDGINYRFKGYEHSHHLAAKVIGLSQGRVALEARNPLIEGMELEWLSSSSEARRFTLSGATVEGAPARALKPNQIFEMRLPFTPTAGELIRKPYSEGDKVVD
ncbi:MAG TPA: U32 family peptidase [Deltaproteobacteria bacterium]|nr:U32 family peptidase [Deltaproteobacteria bacterium]